jgi:hypothetical protein
MVDVLNVLRSLVFFVGLIVANIYILLQRKFDSLKNCRHRLNGPMRTELALHLCLVIDRLFNRNYLIASVLKNRRFTQSPACRIVICRLVRLTSEMLSLSFRMRRGSPENKPRAALIVKCTVWPAKGVIS